MDTEQTKSQVIELFVRMDCNGCVHRIKRALHNLDGIHEVYIDTAQQKLTLVGRIEPEKIAKAIKRTRKILTVSTEPKTAEPEAANPAPLDPPKEDSPAENIAVEVKPVPETSEGAIEQPKDVEEVRVVHQIPKNCSSDYRPSAIISEYMCSGEVPRESEYLYGEEIVHTKSSVDGGSITCMFNEENPNACTIV